MASADDRSSQSNEVEPVTAAALPSQPSPFPFLVNVHVIWLYVAVIVSASITQFFAPANDSVLPEIAPEEELGAANSIMAIAQFGSTAVGFALAGFLASSQSINAVFWIDSA